jgi:DNA (cytosine-5)-methyltransferase 1
MMDGRHQSRKNTPIYCEKCGALLPRPTMIDKETGKRRIIKGFDSAYRRMTWDTPAGTITQNFQYEASDKKLHPDQNRTLSIYEAMVLQTITDYVFKFEINGKPIRRNLCCQIIGESVPPKLIELIIKQVIKISK